MTLDGSWGVGRHKIAVNFLNAAHGGTAQSGQNLIVTGASYIGAANPHEALALMAAGSRALVAGAA